MLRAKYFNQNPRLNQKPFFHEKHFTPKTLQNVQYTHLQARPENFMIQKRTIDTTTTAFVGGGWLFKVFCNVTSSKGSSSWKCCAYIFPVVFFQENSKKTTAIHQQKVSATNLFYNPTSLVKTKRRKTFCKSLWNWIKNTNSYLSILICRQEVR